jgi:hypothetical protein
LLSERPYGRSVIEDKDEICKLEADLTTEAATSRPNR